MTDKAKRKGKPRNRMGLYAFIVILGILAIYLHYPITPSSDVTGHIVSVEPHANYTSTLWRTRLDADGQTYSHVSMDEYPSLTMEFVSSDWHVLQTSEFVGQARFKIFRSNVASGQLEEHLPCDGIKWCYHYGYSPDGNWLVFYRYDTPSEEIDGFWNLYLYHFPSRVTQYVNQVDFGYLAQYSYAVWSSDSTQFTYPITMRDYENDLTPTFATHDITQSQIISDSVMGIPVHSRLFVDDERVASLRFVQQSVQIETLKGETLNRPLADPFQTDTSSLTIRSNRDEHDQSSKLFWVFWRNDGNIVTDIYLADLESGDLVLIKQIETNILRSIDLNRDATALLLQIQHYETYELTTSVVNLKTGDEFLIDIPGNNPQWLD